MPKAEHWSDICTIDLQSYLPSTSTSTSLSTPLSTTLSTGRHDTNSQMRAVVLGELAMGQDGGVVSSFSGRTGCNSSHHWPECGHVCSY